MIKTELSYEGKMYTVRYHHTRFLNKDGKIPMTNGGITFAYIEINEELSIAAKAVCSLQDNFNKKIGRMMAMGRLKNKIEYGKGQIMEKPTKNIIYDIIYRC